MNLVRLYIGIVYENDKRIGFSHVLERLDDELLDSGRCIIKKQSVENLIANILKRTLMRNEDNPTHVGIYSDNEFVILYIKRLIGNKHYDNNRQLKYQPRGSIFKKIRESGVRIMLFDEPKAEAFSVVQNNAIFALQEEKNSRDKD